MTWLITIAPLVVVGFLYLTNIGQIVHRTPNPTWWERIGR